MGKPLSKQELHNLAMNIVGRQLEAEGFEFLGVNSKLKKNPQFVCLKEKQLYFIVVRNVAYPDDPQVYDKALMKKIKIHADKHQQGAKVYYAGVGLSNAKDPKIPVYLNEDYVVEYRGPIEVDYA